MIIINTITISWTAVAIVSTIILTVIAGVVAIWKKISETYTTVADNKEEVVLLRKGVDNTREMHLKCDASNRLDSVEKEMQRLDKDFKLHEQLNEKTFSSIVNNNRRDFERVYDKLDKLNDNFTQFLLKVDKNDTK